MTFIYGLARSRESVFEVTVEDPAPGFEKVKRFFFFSCWNRDGVQNSTEAKKNHHRTELSCYSAFSHQSFVGHSTDRMTISIYLRSVDHPVHLLKKLPAGSRVLEKQIQPEKREDARVRVNYTTRC